MKKENIIWFIIVTVVAIIVGVIVTLNKDRIVEIKDYMSELNRITSDELEIEKKWLIDKNNIKYDLENAEVIEIEQTYISFSPEIRVRRLNGGEAYSFAVKTNMTSDGMIRNEIDENITEEEYENLFSKKESETIYKTRYQFLDGDYLIAIDIFSGDLEGLAYMEIEFENEEEANEYATPDWVIKDVTDDVKYKNGSLARYGIPESYYEYIKE